MKRHALLFSFVLLALAVAPAAYPSCSLVDPPGPTFMYSLVYDPNFQQDCVLWEFDGDTYYGDGSGAELYDTGYVEQDIYVPTTGGMEATIGVEVVTAGHSSDRLWVELRSSTGTLLETLDVYTKDTATDYYDYTNIANNYYGQTIKLRFRYSHGPIGGTTTFKVTAANLWAF